MRLKEVFCCKTRLHKLTKMSICKKINCFQPITATIIIVITNKLVSFAIMKQCLLEVLMKNSKIKLIAHVRGKSFFLT